LSAPAGDAFDLAAGLEIDLGEGAVVAGTTAREQWVGAVALLGGVDHVTQRDRAALVAMVVDHAQDVGAHELVLLLVHGPAVEAVGAGGVEDLHAPAFGGQGVGVPRLLGYGAAVWVALHEPVLAGGRRPRLCRWGARPRRPRTAPPTSSVRITSK
jgi:hypothetical protein